MVDVSQFLASIFDKARNDLDSLAEIKGVSDLILKRLGKDIVAAVKKGLRKPHGPIPKLDTTVRRRMDRATEKRLAALKDWRGPRSEALKLDPGVLCPNAALEAIADDLADQTDILLKLRRFRSINFALLKVSPDKEEESR